jgi:hypothetical protein
LTTTSPASPVWPAGRPAAAVVVVPLLVAVAVAVAGCGPTPTCRAWVACQQAVDPSVDVTAWDEGGRCWSTPQTAAACDAQCEVALSALQALPALPPACPAPGAPSGDPSGADAAGG